MSPLWTSNVQVVALTATDTTNMSKVLIGMSGGVDSSVAAALLLKEGYDVKGVTLRLTDGDTSFIDDARKVCDKIGIPFEVLDFRDTFKTLVENTFVAEFKSGRTPNPCVICNREIKFGVLFDYAMEQGADFVATGHYARIECIDGVYSLYKAESLDKDQTYFLYALSQEKLSKVLMPLGGFNKDYVRELARQFDLPVWEKKDSQDICFIPDGDKNAYLKKFLPDSPGDFLDTEGNVIGHHTGIFNYTYGQRKGLGAYGEPRFVLSINPDNNSIVLGKKGDEFCESFYIEQVNEMIDFGSTLSCSCKVRYSANDLPCTVTKENNMYKVTLSQPARSITPGQACVFYQGDRLLGGGTIVTR